MSGCKVNFNKSGKVFYKDCDNMSRGCMENCCDLKSNCGCDCNCECSCGCMDKNPCVDAPCAEPKLLTLVANAVFDATGINLCKTEIIKGDEVGIDFGNYPNACGLTIHVIDLCTDDSSITFLDCKPNCVRIKLKNLHGKFEGRLLDVCGKVLATFIFYATFLADCGAHNAVDCGCGCDCVCKCKCDNSDTNPSSICLDLYAPNGVVYDGECPVISFVGLDVNSDYMKQGIVLQAAAKTLKMCVTKSLHCQQISNLSLSMGLTLFVKSIYPVEYKFCHEGIHIPPKAHPIEDEEDQTCEKFVNGSLIVEKAQPLDLNC